MALWRTWGSSPLRVVFFLGAVILLPGTVTGQAQEGLSVAEVTDGTRPRERQLDGVLSRLRPAPTPLPPISTPRAGWASTPTTTAAACAPPHRA
jgi:hypothetical protein